MLPWYVFALGAAGFIVIRDLAQKRALREEHTEEMLVARSVFLLPLLLVLPFVIPVDVDASMLPWLYLSSIIASIGYILLMKGLRHLDISVAAGLQNVGPLFLLVISAVLLGYRPSAMQLLGIILIVAGTYILEGRNKDGLAGMLKKIYGDRYAWGVVVAAFVLSVSQLFDKVLIGKGVSPFAYLFWVLLFCNINYWLFQLGRNRFGEIEKDVVRDWRWLGLGALALFAQFVCYFIAVERGPVMLVITITRLSAFGLVFLGGRMYHESHQDERAIAAAIMLLGALLILV